MGNASIGPDHIGGVLVRLEADNGRRLVRRSRRRGRKKWGEYVSREAHVRSLLRTITGLHNEWKSVRPQWLMGTKGKPLELDCYSKTWLFPGYPQGTAVEVDGVQHSRWHKLYHANALEYEEQKQRDALKDRLTTDRKVKLVRIPHRGRLDDTKLAAYLLERIIPP